MFLLASGFGRDDDRSAAWRFHVYGPELLLFGVLWRLCQISSFSADSSSDIAYYWGS
jgi:hypothetical protein